MGDTDAAFTVALSQNGAKPSTNTLTYPQFVAIAWAYTVFLEFDTPVIDGTITRKEMKRGFDRGILPSRMSPQIIDNIYNALDPNKEPGTTVTFPTFVLLTMFYNKFNDLVKDAPGLSFANFCKILSDKIFK